MQRPEQKPEPGRNYEAERRARFFGGRIVLVCILMMLAYLVTSSIFITLFIILCGGLYLAEGYEPFDELLASDPLLRWATRIAPVAMLLIFCAALLRILLGY